MTAIVAWARERLPLQVFGPAIGLLAIATAWVTGSYAIPAAARATMLIGVLIVQFRLWDDLEDADRDRRVHPDRILPQSRRAPFVFLLVMLTLLGLTITAGRWPVGAALVMLDGLALLCYRRLRSRVRDATWRYGVLILKYPAVLCIASLAAGGTIDAHRFTVASVATYACAAAYEYLHDHRMSTIVPGTPS